MTSCKFLNDLIAWITVLGGEMRRQNALVYGLSLAVAATVPTAKESW